MRLNEAINIARKLNCKFYRLSASNIIFEVSDNFIEEGIIVQIDNRKAATRWVPNAEDLNAIDWEPKANSDQIRFMLNF